MQPLVSSTIFSTLARPVTTLPSIPTSPISFMMTATRFPRSPCSSTCRSSVVFPLPRKPVRMSTATVRMNAQALACGRGSAGHPPAAPLSAPTGPPQYARAAPAREAKPRGGAPHSHARTRRSLSMGDRSAGEAVGDRLAEQREERRGDVVDRDVGEFAAQRGFFASGGEDEDAVPVVVGFVGAGVVFEGVDAGHADGADGAPVEVAEVDDQVGGDAVDGAIEVLWAVRLGADRPTRGIGDRFDAGDEIGAHALVVGGI